MQMKQVMNHNKDNGLLNMIRRTDTMISVVAGTVLSQRLHKESPRASTAGEEHHTVTGMV